MNAPDAAPSASPATPHWTQLANGGALLLLTAIAIAGARAALRTSWLLAPASVALLAIAALAGWGATVQLSGGAHMDDHPWV